MTDLGEAEPNDGRANRPPKHNWEAKERFFDLKFSHYVELILTGILVCVGYLQYEVYTRQARIMDQQARIAQATSRAWVWPKVTVGSDLVFDEKGATITFAYSLKNGGNTPALNTWPSMRFFAFDFGKFDPAEPFNPSLFRPQTKPSAEVRKFCQNHAKLTEEVPVEIGRGDPILNGEALDSAVTITIPK
jgi:hypothetical protein